MHRDVPLTLFTMETFDFDRHFKRMERADDQELALFQRELADYLHGPPHEQDNQKAAARRSARKQALARLRERSQTELALINELIGTPATA